MRPPSDKEMHDIIGTMSMIERYELLGTLRRDGVVLSEHQKQIRWCILRDIVASAYRSSYKRFYFKGGEWYVARHDDHEPNSYEMELNRILDLVNQIKSYELKGKEPCDGYTKNGAAARLAVSGYTYRFRQLDAVLFLERKGIGFTKKHYGNYGTKGCKRYPYWEAVNIELLLKNADWSIPVALKLWAQRKNDKHYKMVALGKSPRKHPHVTPAQAVGMYARLQRHMMVKDIALPFSLDTIHQVNDSGLDPNEQISLENSQPIEAVLGEYRTYIRRLNDQKYRANRRFKLSDARYKKPRDS